MKKSILYVFLAIIFSCSTEEPVDIENYFIAHIHSLDEKGFTQTELDRDSRFRVLMNIFVTNSDRLILVEGQSWNLYLTNREGNVIDVKGGLGRGPGEFDLINHAYLSDDDVLHILDLGLMRVTKFNFQGDEPELVSVTNLPPYEMSIRKIFPLSNGNYLGVFRENMFLTGGSFQNLVYTLDENFQQIDKISSFFGGTMVPFNITFIQDGFSAEALWHFKNDILFYARSDSFNIRKIINNDQLDMIDSKSSLMSIPKFENDIYVKNNLSDHIEYIFSFMPERRTAFNDIEIFKYYRQFYISGEKLFFNIYNAVNGPGYILIYNIETSKKSILKTPPWFTIHQIMENEVIGINNTEGANEIISIRF